ncbi:hypothetical protein RM543_10060 [Roseicyclus sp. F158]|uniref:Uncharacterized protein n=1 Tax=Tropicimonas omnivorans TaxID=3075590 RepID=A0ABU3DH39_9RHOB|nr:hypothetical protein [Roseicyclus sp. F158]MDT0683032.1 hypothetical protein [Roseicyclus sp. F158]
MGVRQDHRVRGSGVDPKRRQRLDRAEQVRMSVKSGLFGGHARIDDDMPVTAHQHPRIEIEHQRHIRLRLEDEVLPPCPVRIHRVPDAVDLPD